MKQYLTRKQLIELYEADDCKQWKTSINGYLDLLVFKHDDFKVEINQYDIDLANKNCTAKQKELLTKAGLRLTQEVSVCDSKDGDCIKINSERYWINKREYVSLLMQNEFGNWIIKRTNRKDIIDPDIKGELVKEPLQLLIKIN